MFPLTMVRNMRLAFRSSIRMPAIRYYLSVLPAISVMLSAQQLPDGSGRAEMEKMCRQCHELARSVSLRQDRDGWDQTMTKMAAFGMKSSDKDYALVRDYLAKNFP